MGACIGGLAAYIASVSVVGIIAFIIVGFLLGNVSRFIMEGMAQGGGGSGGYSSSSSGGWGGGGYSGGGGSSGGGGATG